MISMESGEATAYAFYSLLTSRKMRDVVRRDIEGAVAGGGEFITVGTPILCF
jgi:hypothetical protein